MLKTLSARLRQGHQTSGFPDVEPLLPARFRGLPVIDHVKCGDGCSACADHCPTQAIKRVGRHTEFDMGACLFCTECEHACPQGAIRMTSEYRLSTSTRDALHTDGKALQLAHALDKRMLSLFGRSLRLRQVSAGGCGGCEADVAVLSTVVFDISRFGIQFVASPRHADGMLITGAVSKNMSAAVRSTYEAIPDPKLVIAVGACAISGGPFRGHPEVENGVSEMIPVDLFVPGCPPHPYTILDGLLRLLDRREPRIS
ncbi:MAG: NADH-quinone oxidoreductase subunit NuoB [Deltaproteobacteria bacterium]|nr:NADH-quinone oxidoreductase subunit NuoB [Deltaproteobacteria bacterium]